MEEWTKMFSFLRRKRTKALLAAVEGNGIGAVGHLLQRGADPNGTNDIGWTCLVVAASRGNSKLVDVLLDYGAAVDVRCPAKVDPSDYAWNAARRSMGSQASLDPYRNEGWTPLMEAASKGHVDVVKILLSRNADSSATTRSGKTALMEAAMNGHTAIVEAILDRGASVDAVNNDGWTALFCAAARGHVGTVKVLLANGADVNKKNNSNATALMWAVRANTETVKALLQAGAQVNEISIKGGSALVVAVMLRQPDMVRELLDAGADAKVKDKEGSTLLELAQQTGHKQIIDMIEGAVA